MNVASLLSFIGDVPRTDLSREGNGASVRIVAAARDSSLAVVAALVHEGFASCPAFDTAVVFVPDGDELTCVYSTGTRGAYFVGVRLCRLESRTSVARCARIGYRVPTEDRDSRLIPGDRRGIAFPLCDAFGRLHAIVYWSTTLERTSNEEALAELVEIATVAYVLACERESDRASATFDALTGLYAPRAFRSLLSEMIHKRAHLASPVSLWFIDSDHFKIVNDQFGHAVGDSVLQQIATTLKSALKIDCDIAARNGGDEFCALLWQTHKSQALIRAAKFCAAIRASDFLTGIAMTVSLGVATFPDDAQGANELLEAADTAMYHAKRSGRDRVAFRSATRQLEVLSELS